MVMMLTTSMRVPLALAACRNAVPLPSGPLCSTGIVTETDRPELAAASRLIAWKRRLIEAVFAIAAPSATKARRATWYLLITLWYAPGRRVVSGDGWAPSTPPAPAEGLV